MNNNFYSVLFNKDTGIIIANGDKGSERIIELWFKRNDLTSLMPKIFSKNYSKYIEN